MKKMERQIYRLEHLERGGTDVPQCTQVYLEWTCTRRKECSQSEKCKSGIRIDSTSQERLWPATTALTGYLC
jgi:hypothetical protein